MEKKLLNFHTLNFSLNNSCILVEVESNNKRSFYNTFITCMLFILLQKLFLYLKNDNNAISVKNSCCILAAYMTFFNRNNKF